MNVNCPSCQKTIRYSTDNPYRPFCSERCRLIDLGAWANESYTIPVQSTHFENLEDLENLPDEFEEE